MIAVLHVGWTFGTLLLAAASEFAPYAKDSESCLKLENAPCSTFDYHHGLIPERLSLLLEDADSKTGNMLFRGNLPLTVRPKVDFPTEELLDAMRAEATKGKLPFPEKYQLYVFSLMWNGQQPDQKLLYTVPEPCQYWAEKCYGEPQHKIIHWPLMGDPVYPYELQPEERKTQAQSLALWQADKLDEKVEYLHELLTTPEGNGVTRLIVFHGRFGKDRTGELSAAYNMRYKNKSLGWAWERNKSVRPFWQFFLVTISAMSWYCLYLEERFPEEKSRLGCFDIQELDSKNMFFDLNPVYYAYWL